MAFKVTARTLLQLGAELISSDAIAFYELIKNSFDAYSKKVDVRVVVRVANEDAKDFWNQISELKLGLDDVLPVQQKQFLIDKIDLDAPEIDLLSDAIHSARLVKQIDAILKEANYIEFRDKGEGMSLSDLEEVYLTIGTRSRQKQRKNILNSPTIDDNRRPILGEKGLGRLSVMRLGNGLRVETTKKNELFFNNLEIDWSIFSHDSDKLLQEISIDPFIGKRKNDPSYSGTLIRIYDLNSEWSKGKLENVAATQLNRFIDPFGNVNRNFISLWYNKTPIVLKGVNKELLKYAHATMKIRFEVESLTNIYLVGHIVYRLHNAEKTFRVESNNLQSITNGTLEDLQKLGPFSAELYWFNRKALVAYEGVGDLELVKQLVRQWAGGLMLFRDGFRVNPYGGYDDDWLKVDNIALGVSGYKLNRRQIIGKVDITSKDNAALVDQTNREGLRDNIEREALISILQYTIWKELKLFLDTTEKEVKKGLLSLSINEIEKRIESGQKTGKRNLEVLINKYPVLKQEASTLKSIEEILDESRALFKSARALADEYKNRLDTTLHLAGLGLMVDIVAHELNRSTQHALETIGEIGEKNLTIQAQSLMATLRSQLKTLQARLKVLDPLGPSGRQRKEDVNLNHLIYDTVLSNEAKFQRHHIKWSVETDDKQQWIIKVVPGMIVQIIENLVTNSVYWLEQQRRIEKNFQPCLTITIEQKNKRVLIYDNGPGIPVARLEEVFYPFFTTKPPDQGKGLGLYISREIALYHGANLFLLYDEPINSLKSNLHTFVLDLSSLK